MDIFEKLRAEGLLPVSDAIETMGLSTFVSTTVRNLWSSRGLLGQNGQRVILETIQIGGKRYTSLPALERFLAATSSRPRQTA